MTLPLHPPPMKFIMWHRSRQPNCSKKVQRLVSASDREALERHSNSTPHQGWKCMVSILCNAIRGYSALLIKSKVQSVRYLRKIGPCKAHTKAHNMQARYLLYLHHGLMGLTACYLERGGLARAHSYSLPCGPRPQLLTLPQWTHSLRKHSSMTRVAFS